jgi:hypothetical protein
MRHLYSFTDFLNEGKVEDIHAKFYAGMEVSTFHQIITADPTSIVQNGETKKMGTYSKWLLKLFQDGKLLLEDLYKATEYLTRFDKLKAQKVITGTAADINRYDSLPDLFKHIKEIGGTGETSEDESYLLGDRYFINSGEAEVFHEDDDYLIVIPRTLKASQFYAHGTEWCTRFPDMFKEYSEKGDLYIVIVKRRLNTTNTHRRMQFHFQTEQYMDMDDRNVMQQVKTDLQPIFQRAKGGWRLLYERIGEYCGMGIVVYAKYKYGIVAPDGTVVAPLIYDNIGDEHENMLLVTRNKRNGFIDRDGNEVVPCKYVWSSNFKGGRARVRLGDKYGFIDNVDNLVVPCEYDWVYNFEDGRAIVEINGKHGLVDLSGNEVVPCKYNSIGEFNDGCAKFMHNGKCGYIDRDGNVLTKLMYDWGATFKEGRAKVNINNKYGFIDTEGNEVTPLKYDMVMDYDNGNAKVLLDGKEGYIDIDGNEYWN